MKKKLLPILLFALVALTNAQNSVSEATNTSTPGILTVTTTTMTAGGSYANSNVSAIWIQDSTGKLINTMMYYTNNSNSSATDLTTWYGMIGAWANRKLATTTDAITGATQNSYGTRTCYWGKTTSLATVVDGIYTVKMELADEGSPSVSVGSMGHKLATYTFTKGSANSTGTLSGSAASCFTAVSIQWVPTATGIDEVKLTNLYSVYPNPTKSSIYVNGSDVQQVEIFTLAGKSILKTNQQNINLSLLARGSYLAQITTAKGNFVKKIIKE